MIDEGLETVTLDAIRERFVGGDPRGTIVCVRDPRGRTDQRHARESIGVGDRRREGRPAAHRIANEMRPSESEHVDRRRHLLNARVHRVGRDGVRRVALAVSDELQPNGTPVGRDRLGSALHAPGCASEAV